MFDPQKIKGEKVGSKDEGQKNKIKLFEVNKLF